MNKIKQEKNSDNMTKYRCSPNSKFYEIFLKIQIDDTDSDYNAGNISFIQQSPFTHFTPPYTIHIHAHFTAKDLFKLKSTLMM